MEPQRHGDAERRKRRTKNRKRFGSKAEAFRKRLGSAVEGKTVVSLEEIDTFPAHELPKGKK
jgi:hypothetical protein